MGDVSSDIEVGENRGRSVSRRDFLKYSIPALLGAAWGAQKLTKDIWQPGVVHLGIDALRNPETIETTLQTSASLLEKLALKDGRAESAPVVKLNPFYRPISEIVGEVINAREKAGKPVKFQRVGGYKNYDYYLDKLQESIDDPKNRDRGFIETGELNEKDYLLGYLPGTFTNFYDLEHPIFPSEVSSIWEASNRVFDVSRELLVPGSGIANYVIKQLGPESRELLEFVGGNYWTYHKEEVDTVVRSYLLSVKTHIEAQAAKEGAVSAGVIFGWFLDKNAGDIGSSLLDTMIFLKFMARQDTTIETFDEVKLDPELSKANEEWFKKNILDEYGKVGNYHELPHETFSYKGLLSWSTKLADREVDKDLHLINQIGKPYHAWNIALMPMVVPPSIAQAGVAWRQYDTFPAQGSVKTAADFEAALELDQLQKTLLKYEAK